MGKNAIQIDSARTDQLLPNAFAVLKFRQVARRLLQVLDELVLELVLKMPGELDGAGGVAKALAGLQTADLIEEPTAAREHEHPVPLHFQQPKGGANEHLIEIRMSVGLQELAHVLGTAIQHDLNVSVAGGPWVREALPPARGENMIEMALESIERLAQRTTPFLLPAASHVAPAVGAPALYPMFAAPRAVLVNLDFPGRGVQF